MNPKYHNVLLKSFFFILALTILLSDFIMIGSNHLSSLPLNGSLSNLAGTGVATLFFILISNETRLRKMIVIAIMCALGLIIYEVLQLILPWQVFDIQDIIATFTGLLLIIAVIYFNHILICRKPTNSEF